MSVLNDLALWSVLKSKATPEQQTMVEHLVADATAVLDRVIETFPAYTLHNATHSRNVAVLMGNLLGPAIDHLSALEAAMLILSAFWHDIGMVFSEEERAALTTEPHWHQFLAANPEAEVKYGQAEELTNEIAEWYCRWRHADRVYVYLDREAPGRMLWGPVNMRDALGELCRSHNLDVTDIQSNAILQRDYLETADLKFCAVLLRLADILDFDNTRSPDAVYQLLGLARRDTTRKDQSDVEWRKHLSSAGFTFPKERGARYRLGFVAGPTHPAVEHDIRQFIDTIEEQIEKCDGLRALCSERWRDFVLPRDINRDNIKSNGYRFGEYRFTLDQIQILNLLMGENLYEDRYIFVRELVQNAIDTSRYREYYERVNGNPGFRAEPIQISAWRDQAGRQWVRFDDCGMGMDERIVREHLLKVGSSYYETARFRAEVLRAQKKGASNFVPISRFGIGLLSCFIVADRVEISSRRLNPGQGPAEPLRLSLNGVHGFYTLQTGNMQALPMPRDGGDEPGYRYDIGTSVSLRLDPAKEWSSFDAKPILDKHVISSPVRIELQGEPVGHDYETFVKQPWLPPTAIPFSKEQMKVLADLTSFEFSEPLHLEFLPLDLTKFSRTEEFHGQMLVAVIRPTEEWQHLVEGLKPYFTIKVRSAHEINTEPYVPTLPETGFVFEISTIPYLDRAEFVRQLRDTESQAAPGEIKTVLPGLAQRLENAGAELHWFPEFKPGSFRESPSYTSIDGATASWARAFGGIDFASAIDRLPEAAGPNINAVDRRNGTPRPIELPSLLSHNGVVMPTFPSVTDTSTHFYAPLSSRIVIHGPLGYPSLSWGAIAFSDSLRPEVDVSRNALRRMPLRAYSTALISLHAALKQIGLLESAKEDLERLTIVVGSKMPTLGDLLKEDLLNPGDWEEIALFREASGNIISPSQLRELLKAQNQVTLRAERSWPYDRSFTTLCACAVAQLEFNLVLQFPADGSTELVAQAGEPRELYDGEKLFPPLMFLPFSNHLFLVRPVGINRDHPISKWLLGIVPRLSHTYPGIFQQLKAALLDAAFPKGYSGSDRASFVKEINDVLNRMKSLEVSLRPKSSYSLTEQEVRDLSEFRNPHRR